MCNSGFICCILELSNNDAHTSFGAYKRAHTSAHTSLGAHTTDILKVDFFAWSKLEF